jgi:hypothetical protein
MTRSLSIGSRPERCARPFLAQDVLYEFESMAASYDDYFNNRTYRRAVDSVIDKVRTAFPHLMGWDEYLAEKNTAR